MRISSFFLLCSSLFLSAPTARAAGGVSEHRFEIDGTLGYRFGGAKNVELGDVPVKSRLTVDDAPSYGGLFSYRIQSNGSIFLSYSRQETMARIGASQLVDTQITDYEEDISIEYFQFGGNLQTRFHGFVPYLGLSAGLTRIASRGDHYSSHTRFNLTFDGGLRWELLPILDLRILGRLPLTLVSGKFYCLRDGCAVVLNGSPFVQGEVQLGLGVRF